MQTTGIKRTLICMALVVSSLETIGAERPDWAYPVASKEQPPNRDDGKPKSVPGSRLQFTQAQINDLSNAVDWFPDQHAPMPRPVAHGEGAALACAACHLTSGMGHPESSPLAGQPIAYLERQLADFKRGDRQDPARMTAIGRALSDEDARAASEWFAAIKPKPWIMVVETEQVPLSYGNGGRMRLPLPGSGTEPLGRRIVELPQSVERALCRDPNSGFVAYVPVGSVAKGKIFVTTGGGKGPPCASCHGAALTGMNEVPGIAGVSTLYVARQLFDFQSGARGGASAITMKPIAANLDEDDFINIAAYLSSLPP
jgi:cytochrome c553